MLATRLSCLPTFHLTIGCCWRDGSERQQSLGCCSQYCSPARFSPHPPAARIVTRNSLSGADIMTFLYRERYAYNVFVNAAREVAGLQAHSMSTGLEVMKATWHACCTETLAVHVTQGACLLSDCAQTGVRSDLKGEGGWPSCCQSFHHSLFVVLSWDVLC